MQISKNVNNDISMNLSVACIAAFFFSFRQRDRSREQGRSQCAETAATQANFQITLFAATTLCSSYNVILFTNYMTTSTVGCTSMFPGSTPSIFFSNFLHVADQTTPWILLACHNILKMVSTSHLRICGISSSTVQAS